MAFAEGIGNGELLTKAGISMSVLLQGYAGGIVRAFALTTLAVSTELGRDVLDTLTARFRLAPESRRGTGQAQSRPARIVLPVVAGACERCTQR